MFFHSLYDLERIAVIGVLAYITLIVMLRFTGKRTLSKMNAFDLIVTVALGSTLSAAILNNQVSLVECALALALLCALQYVVTFTSVRSQMFAKLVKSEPALLYFEGSFLPEALRRERVTEKEALAAMRSQGVADLGRVKAVVLETDGSLSVVQDKGGALDTLRDVSGLAETRTGGLAADARRSQGSLSPSRRPAHRRGRRRHPVGRCVCARRAVSGDRPVRRLSRECTPPARLPAAMRSAPPSSPRGYVQVVVERRGMGRSGGTQNVFLSPEDDDHERRSPGPPPSPGATAVWRCSARLYGMTQPLSPCAARRR